MIPLYAICNYKMKNRLSKYNINMTSNTIINKIGKEYIEINKCYFIKEFEQNARYDTSNFDSRTSYECFVNSFRPNEYTEKRIHDSSITFICSILRDWRSKIHEDVNGIFSYNFISKTYNVKIYIDRFDEPYIDTNLDGYEFECILFVSSNKSHMIGDKNKAGNSGEGIPGTHYLILY